MDKTIKMEVKELFGKLHCKIKLNKELTEELKSKLQNENEIISVFFSEILEEGFAKRGIKINHTFISETEAAA